MTLFCNLFIKQPLYIQNCQNNYATTY